MAFHPAVLVVAVLVAAVLVDLAYEFQVEAVVLVDLADMFRKVDLVVLSALAYEFREADRCRTVADAFREEVVEW